MTKEDVNHRKMNTRCLIKCLLVAACGGLGYVACSTLLQPVCACGNSGLTILRASYRAQQAHVMAEREPITTISDLEKYLDMPFTDQVGHTYKLEKRSGLIYQWAIATRKDIPSYVSVLEILPIDGEDATQTHTSRLLICETEKLGQVSIPVPLVDNTNDFQCDGGTQVVFRDRKVF